jgi:DNA-binding MarR family transcriptional regulator
MSANVAGFCSGSAAGGDAAGFSAHALAGILMTKLNTKAKTRTTDPLELLYRRPGFLLRRANQIAAALFLEAVAEFDVTTTQYGALVVISSRGSIDQVSLARLLGVDRSTTGLVLGNLERRRAIRRTSDPQDGRRRVLALTEAGERLLKDISAAAERVPKEELSIFSPAEAAQFISLLTRFVEAFNTSVRAPLYDRSEE